MLAHHVFGRIGIEHKLAQRIAEGTPVEFFAVVAGDEIVQTLLRPVVNQHHLRLMLTGAQPSVQCQTVYPAGQVGRRDAASQHPLEIHGQMEGYALGIVSVDDDHIFTPPELVRVLDHGCRIHSCKFRHYF